jgi:TPR repeat protein
MRVQGLGVERDVELGKQLLKRACERKDREACGVLESLAAGSAATP